MKIQSKFACAFILIMSLAIALFFKNHAVKTESKDQAPSDIISSVGVKVQTPDQSPSNPQEGMSGKQITELLTKRLTEAGGSLTLWSEKLKQAKEEGALIKTVKLTPALEVFLSKVILSLTEKGPLVYAKGAQIEGLMQAKAASVVFNKENFLPLPSKAVLYKNFVFFAPNPKSRTRESNLHPQGLEIDVPTDFSRGMAIDLSSRDHIMAYEWNFHIYPPVDGVLGIETELE